MLKILITIFLVFGFSFTFWSLIGLIRLGIEALVRLFSQKNKLSKLSSFIQNNPNQTAICLVVTNKELSIENSLQDIKKIISPCHIYLANDGSTDLTSSLAKKSGCQVYDIYPKLGQTKALSALADHFNLFSRYQYIFSLSKSSNYQNEVAICMAAHNEEPVIEDAICSLKKIISPQHIYIANDGSTDLTHQLTDSQGCQVLDIYPNQGKAGALVSLLEHFNIYQRYAYVLFVDADTRLRQDYLKNALPLFNDPKVAAVAGFARSQWKDNVFIAYRSRIWFTLQTFFRFGMTWKFTNFNMIVPGFASMYRTQVLKQIEIDKPGLVIEDFNMTFELQKKKLGKIAHYPNITGYTQDPDSFKSYTSQIKRWNLGFWQTVRANGVWPSLFCLNLAIYLLEMFTASLIFLVWPALFSFSASIAVLNFFTPLVTNALPLAYEILKWFIVLIALEQLFIIITVLAQKRPHLFFFGPAMLFFRWLDAYYFLNSLLLAFSTQSTGAWQSPERWQQSKTLVSQAVVGGS